VEAEGNATTTRRYRCGGCVWIPDDSEDSSSGTWVCPGHTENISATFGYVADQRVITAKIYNGMPSIPQKKFWMK